MEPMKRQAVSNALSKLHSMKLKLLKEVQNIHDILTVPTGPVKDMDVKGWIENVQRLNLDSRLRRAIDLLQKTQKMIDELEYSTREQPLPNQELQFENLSTENLKRFVLEAKKEQLQRKIRILENKRKWEMLPNMLPERRTNR